MTTVHNVLTEKHDPIYLEKKYTEDIIRNSLGLRWTSKSQLMTEIIETFSVFLEFSRHTVIMAFGDKFNDRTIDRALKEMEVCNMTSVLKENLNRVAGGALYSINPPEKWSSPDDEKRVNRENRIRRGPSKKIII